MWPKEEEEKAPKRTTRIEIKIIDKSWQSNFKNRTSISRNSKSPRDPIDPITALGITFCHITNTAWHEVKNENEE
jgi:hypothetical protein